MSHTSEMTTSPYDRASSPATPPLVQIRGKPREHWIPSRFNARAVGEDGRLLLWNTLSGSVSAFRAEDRDVVLRCLAVEGTYAPLSRTAEHLSRRGFLVRKETDEAGLFRYRYARQQWRTDLLELILLASEDCNFRCVYCYEKFERGTMSPETREGVRALTLRRIPHLQSLNAGWFGGEPLYGWEAVEELSPFFKDVAERHGIPQTQHMTTNAYLLTEERATKLLEWGCRRFQITVDGLPEEHDCKRVGRDGSPTYAVILDNLRSMHARKDKFNIDLRVNFDRDNLPRLGAFLEALSEDFSGDARFVLRFRGVGKWGGPRDDQLSTCGIAEKREGIMQLRSKAAEMNIPVEAGIRQIAAPGSQVCYAARPYSLIVGATGTLMKCTVALYDVASNVVGQLNPDGSVELDDEHMSKWVNPHWETDSLCQRCYVLPGCQGASCPLTRVTHNERTCCGVKSDLKREMRFTLNEAARKRE